MKGLDRTCHIWYIHLAMNDETIHILRNALLVIMGYNAFMEAEKKYDHDCVAGISKGCKRIMNLIKKLEREN